MSHYTSIPCLHVLMSSCLHAFISSCLYICMPIYLYIFMTLFFMPLPLYIFMSYLSNFCMTACLHVCIPDMCVWLCGVEQGFPFTFQEARRFHRNNCYVYIGYVRQLVYLKTSCNIAWDNCKQLYSLGNCTT